MMTRFIVAWLTTALVFVRLDALWLSQVAPRLDPPLIGEILSHEVKPAPAIAFYLVYLTGVVLLAVLPADQHSSKRALGRGALLGLVSYATYDLTNQATLRVWSATVTLADLAWGTAITAVAAAIANVVVQQTLKRPA